MLERCKQPFFRTLSVLFWEVLESKFANCSLIHRLLFLFVNVFFTELNIDLLF